MGILQRAWNALIQRDAGRLSGRRSVGISRHAGVYVDQDKAMTFSAVWAACRLVSETIAMLPWGYHEEVPAGGNKRLTTDPLQRILRRQANSEMTAFTWKQVAAYHALMWGQFVQRDRA
jgi:phage portal protein BeeE